jgi:hypothetical protein
MCSRLLLEREVEATGEFMKGNEPHPIKMPVMAVQCECGEWYARFPKGAVWVKAEPIPHASA